MCYRLYREEIRSNVFLKKLQWNQKKHNGIKRQERYVVKKVHVTPTRKKGQFSEFYDLLRHFFTPNVLS